MGTLAEALGAHADRTAVQPRVYVDANMPSGIVTFMRETLDWDTLFVLEHDDLRRARDNEHYRLARQLRRTLLTLDHDFLDDQQFPPGESGGVLVLTAPEERGLLGLLRRIDRNVFRTEEAPHAVLPLPLEGRKLHLHVDWTGRECPP